MAGSFSLSDLGLEFFVCDGALFHVLRNCSSVFIAFICAHAIYEYLTKSERTQQSNSSFTTSASTFVAASAAVAAGAIAGTYYYKQRK